MTISNSLQNSSETRHAILIVDDEADFIATSRRMLKSEPYRLFTATSGQEALELLQQHPIDLVVSDCLMPKMDGVTLLSKVQKKYGRTITIMLTAAVDINIAVDAVNTAGVYKFVTKPVEWRGFKIMLRRALESRDLLIEKNRFVALREGAERRLRETESKIKAMSEAVHDAMVMINHKSEILFWNSAAEQMFGISADAVAGKDMHELLVPEIADRTKAQTGLQHFKDSGKGHMVGGVHECTVSRGDGSTFPAEVAVSAFQRGKQWYSVGTIRDITGRRQIEDQIQRTKHELQQIFDTAQVGILVTQKEYVILHCNNMAAQMMGFASVAEMQGLNLFDLLAGTEEKDIFAAQSHESIKHGKLMMMEVPVRHRSGEVVWCTVSAKAEETVSSEEHEQRVVWTINDVSELRRNKEIAENATRVRSEFLARMSHEIRTPMNAIMGFNRLALQTELTKKQHDYLKKSSDAVESLLDIINDILDFSKIDAGKLDLEIVPFGLDEVFDKLNNVISLKAEKKGLKIIYEIGPAIPATLLGDPLRIGQVLLNLVNNAIKFTENGEIIISVSIQRQSDNDIALKFSVKDTGAGMNGAQLERLFKPFSQADSSITRRYGGTGLGLAICKNLIQLMEGEIWAESREGNGSVFSFTVRLGWKKKTNIYRSSTSADLEGSRVLVVDDNPVCSAIFTRALELWRMPAETVESGNAALEKLKIASIKSNPFSIVILDWKMGKLSGVDTVRALLNETGVQPKPKILVATAYGLENVKKEAKGLAIDGFLAKPVQRHVLYTAIKKMLDSRASEKPRQLVENRGCHNTAAVKQTVLVVDDDPLTRETLKRRLTRNGFRVDIAADGFEAGVKALQLKPDLVVLDLFMQGIDGFDVCRSIRKNSQLEGTKILILTGDDSPAHRSRIRQLGADGFLSKTANFKTILRRIEALLKGHDREKRNNCHSSMPGGNLNGMSILVVEDNQINQQVIREILVRSGLVVTLAGDGIDAVKKISRYRYDFVLMDIRMPELDGLAATRKIRASGKSKDDLPIIAMTADAMVGDKERCLDAGMNDYIAKPVRPHELIAVIRRWLKHGHEENGGISYFSSNLPDQIFPNDKDSTHGVSLISYSKGLEMASGNEKLYNRLLQSFRYKYASAVQEIRASLSAQQKDDGVLKVHTLKSVAGTLGAGKLASCAAELEEMLKKDNSEAGIQLDKVEESLEELLGFLSRRHLHDSECNAPQRSENLFDSGRAKEILTKAVSQVDRDFSKTMDLGEQLREVCGGAHIYIRERVDAFTAAIYEIDHAEIRATALELDRLLNDPENREPGLL